ncbi:hypothetical protein Plhal703r1_c01g0006461 [Plasmopara halstedii]
MVQMAGDEVMTELPPRSSEGNSRSRHRSSASRLSVLPVLQFWKAFDLDSKRVLLDSQGNTMKSEKDASVRSRKKLAESTKQFRRLTADADKAAGAGPLLKTYQEEIDHLTRRAKFSENAFFQLYKGLYAAPDPVPALSIVASSLEIDELVDENTKLKRKLKEYKAEFTSLKNQEITIRKLEEQVAATERNHEDFLYQQVEQRTKELVDQLDNAQFEWAQQRRDYERQLEASRTELRDAFAKMDAMQSNLFALKQRSGLARNALDAEMEAMSQTLQLENAQLRKQVEELHRSSVLSDVIDTQLSIHSNTDPETGVQSARELQAKQEQVEAALRQEIIRLNETLTTSSAAATVEAEQLKAALESAEQAQKDLEAQLALRPTCEKFNEMSRQLRILKQLEYNVVEEVDVSSKAGENTEAVDRFDEATVEVEQILMSRVRRLEHALQECERRVHSRTIQVQSIQSELHDRDVRIQEQANLIRDLEESVATLEKTQQKRTLGVIGGDVGSEILMDAMEDQFTGPLVTARNHGAVADTTAISTSSSDGKMLEIVRGQRDRFRERIKELQNEKNRVEQLAQSYKSTVVRLETDNMQLYHKIRYLQSYKEGNKSVGPRIKPHLVLEEGNGSAYDVEARYRGMYEEKMNPFVQFNKMETQQRFTHLNPVDKILLTSARLLLGHRITRNMAFGYILLLHFLVVATLYSFMHVCGITND